MQDVADPSVDQSGARVQRKRVESGIQAAIIEALGLEPSVRLFRNNVGVASFPSGAKVRYGLLPGSADLIGIVTMPSGVGRFLSLECKAPKKNEEEAQRRWSAMVRRMGGFACVCRSVADARAAIVRARAGASE